MLLSLLTDVVYRIEKKLTEAVLPPLRCKLEAGANGLTDGTSAGNGTAKCTESTLERGPRIYLI
jgi:hypothetical protein